MVNDLPVSPEYLNPPSWAGPVLLLDLAVTAVTAESTTIHRILWFRTSELHQPKHARHGLITAHCLKNTTRRL